MVSFEASHQVHPDPVNRFLHTIGKPTIAFFDVDDTLVKGNTGFYTSLHLVRHHILKKRRLAQAVYHYLASFLFRQDVTKIYQIAIGDMAGSHIDDILAIGRETFEKDVKPRLYVEGMKLVEEHQAKGHHVVLLTSAPYMLIRALQKFLGIEEAYCMGPEIADSILVPKLQMPICHAEGKLHFAESASKKHGIPLSECLFYSDHISDLPLLEKIGHPRIINPHRPLLKEALRRGWPVFRFQKTLGEDELKS